MGTLLDSYLKGKSGTCVTPNPLGGSARCVSNRVNVCSFKNLDKQSKEYLDADSSNKYQRTDPRKLVKTMEYIYIVCYVYIYNLLTGNWGQGLS